MIEETDELREAIADTQHAIWAHWMRYMFSCGTIDGAGNWVMPWDKVQRWKRQMDTSYAELSDRERMSDREQADKVINALGDRCYVKDVPLDDLATVAAAMLVWAQPPMDEYAAAATVASWIEKLKAGEKSP